MMPTELFEEEWAKFEKDISLFAVSEESRTAYKLVARKFFFTGGNHVIKQLENMARAAKEEG